ncbi:hypothetical protein [Lentzea sp. NPDC060358]|uniref:hypothetical protein n=1 Tax=Lentzea sp. NPDC060358 TaxID=3347103 RepID=UPI003669E19E
MSDATRPGHRIVTGRQAVLKLWGAVAVATLIAVAGAGQLDSDGEAHGVHLVAASSSATSSAIASGAADDCCSEEGPSSGTGGTSAL